MEVVILCGGKGTRLMPVTDKIPKPLFHIGDRPILWHIMKLYASQGHKEFILLLGYRGKMIRDYFSNPKNTETNRLFVTLQPNFFQATKNIPAQLPP